jgi:uronate dehydrogenase
MRVLVTGAAGSIGRALVAGLPEHGHTVRGLDRVSLPDDLTDVDHTVGDLRDEAVLDAALAGVDGVVHLAAIPSETSYAESVDSHVTGTYAVLEAMRRAGVRRMVYASSNHAVGFTPRPLGGGLLGVDIPARPDSYYGMAKVAAEGLCSLYADRYGVEAVSLRIGSFLERPTTRRHLATWLSPGDAVRLASAALTAPGVRHAVVWGISANTASWWDPEPGRRLGYVAQDDAGAFAADIEREPATERDAAEAAVVGGPFALVGDLDDRGGA